MLYPLFIIALPFIGLIANTLCYKKNPVNGAVFSSYLIGLAFICNLMAIGYIPNHFNPIPSLGLKADKLSLLLSTLILFVSFIVHQFSRRYLAGDRLYRLYFIKLTAITSTTLIMVFSDNLALFWISWNISNGLLVFLMIHKSEWLAARHSGLLTLKTLCLGGLFLLFSFVLMYHASGTLSITQINAKASEIPELLLNCSLFFLILTAFTQSAQWPFHRGLTSSLNSPTPVSALMHAGLVNGGGFILVRFSPLLLEEQHLLIILFLIGGFTAILATLWKLIQNDIKRMLACSTMAQMGFMMMQCGLGLFPAAVAHLCWHGLFKAYLFLNSGSALHAKKETIPAEKRSWHVFLIASIIGSVGALNFALITQKSLFTLDTTTFLIGFAFMSSTQITYSLCARGTLRTRLLPALIIVSIASLLYGESIRLIESLFPTESSQALPHLNSIHLIVFGLFFIFWIGMNLKNWIRLKNSDIGSRIYMSLLNGSQPHPKTITSNRNTYHY